MRRLLPLIVALLATPAMAQAPRLSPEGEWLASLVGPLDLTAEDGVVLSFTKGRVAGSAGCNRFFGGYSLMPGMSFDGIGTTRMACTGRQAEVEAAFLAALAQVNDWRLGEDDSLELLLDGDALLRAFPVAQ
ncbi:META domain-containing protein [Pararhodobacter aggregans]|uniref:META domain-containing protein n=1 Tax=Pararhodobacter aggregans TaxID=404875 RepID=UPI003A94E6EA